MSDNLALGDICRDRDGDTDLHLAVYDNDVIRVEKLLLCNQISELY